MLNHDIYISKSHRYLETQSQEDQIVGRLYRLLIAYEHQLDIPAIHKEIEYLINQARHQCDMIGSDGVFLECFVDRLSFNTTGNFSRNRYNYDDMEIR